ncbi:MAG TPA: sigma-70 family RNA polymerase sigma factor [Nannocystaceae bacterium]|nr:sigma-70 family RNA polymerase sigma factor [Nannocystaceae bacterium]
MERTPPRGAHADEAALVARATAGDPAACRTLVERHERAVFCQLRGILGPCGRGAAVEDLAQDTFLRAFRALPRYENDGRAKFCTWLVTIATRLALNELRRRAWVVQPIDTVVDDFAGNGNQDPARQSSMVGRGVAAAVESLSPPLRAAFLLREIHGLDYAEIAEVLEIDLGTVKSRLSRARLRLREALADEASHLGSRSQAHHPHEES